MNSFAKLALASALVALLPLQSGTSRAASTHPAVTVCGKNRADGSGRCSGTIADLRAQLSTKMQFISLIDSGNESVVEFFGTAPDGSQFGCVRRGGVLAPLWSTIILAPDTTYVEFDWTGAGICTTAQITKG